MRTIMKTQGSKLQKTVFQMLKILVMSYFITGVLLLLLSFVMYKVDLKDQQINLGIIIIMILSTFIGGLLSGKVMKEKRFIYGSILGILYFVILVLVSILMHHGAQLSNDTASMFFICFGGGAIGGMFG